MKKNVLFMFFCVFCVSTAFAVETYTIDGDDIVIKQVSTREVGRHHELLNDFTPEEREIITKNFVSLKDGKEVALPKKDITQIKFGFPAKLIVAVKTVSLKDGKLITSQKNEVKADMYLTVLWLVLPFSLTSIFFVLHCINTKDTRGDWRLAVFAGAIALSVIISGFVGGFVGAFVGAFAGEFAGKFAGKFAGWPIGGVFVGGLIGVFTGMFAGMFAGMSGWQGAYINQYLTTYTVVCVVSYLIGITIRYVINKNSSKEL